MKKTLIFAVMIGLLTAANSQTASDDSSTLQDKSRIAVFKDRIYAYSQYSISAFVSLKNAVVLAYENDTNTKWSAKVDFIYTDLRWDAHLATKYSYTWTQLDKKQFKDNPGELWLEYGMKYKPIFVTFPESVRPFLEINRVFPHSMLGIRGWWFNKSEQLGGQIVSDPDKENKDGSITRNRQGISMFGEHALWPLTNTLDSAGVTPVDWWIGNSLNFWTTEIYLSYPVSNTFNFRIALKVVDIVNSQTTGQSHWAYVSWAKNTWDNHVILNLVSEARYRASGPTIGFDLHKSFINVLFQAGVLQSDKVKRQANWGDVDNIVNSKTESGKIYYTILYNGDFPFSITTRETIPTTELQLKLNTPNLNLGKNVCVRFNLGWFASAFYNAPVAAMYEFPGGWTIGDGTHWELKKQTLYFTGLTVGASIHF